MKLSIIIPAYNEQNTLKRLLDYIQSVEFPIEYEIIIIDDASIDRTFNKEFVTKNTGGTNSNIRIFSNRSNRGKGFSVRMGIEKARGDIIIVQDADTEYNPHDMPKLIEPILKGESTVVYGSRFLNNAHPDGMSFPCLFANKFLTKLTNIFFDLKLTDMETCYKAFKTDIIKTFNLKANRFSFEPEVTALLAKRRIEIKELPITYHSRSPEEGKKIKARDFVFAVLMLFWQRLTR